MNKRNILGVLLVMLSVMSLSLPAYSETFGRQKAKILQAEVAQRCASEEMNPALCQCQTERASSPQFLMFAEGIKTDADLPKMNDYYIRDIITPCLMDKSIAKKVCLQTMKEKTSEYSDKVLGDYCACMAEEIQENFREQAASATTADDVRKIFAIEEERAHKNCNTQRKD